MLISEYIDDTTEPYTVSGYNCWIVNLVKNQYIKLLNQIVFGTLESYFQMKEGVKSGDGDMLMAGMLEIEKLFFIKKSLRNYQQGAAYRGQDMVKMPKEMLNRRLRFQTTEATAYNSTKIPGNEEEDLTTKYSKYDLSQNKEKPNPFSKNSVRQRRQGNDAAMEQVIKRSKKGAKIKNMDNRGWVTEFRCMEMNIALRKKMERDLDIPKSEEGSHKRNNLKEIIMFEVLLEESDWLKDPQKTRNRLLSLDGKEELSENLSEFWNLCGQNRDLGIQQLSRHEVVDFKDITIL